jgi:hypothetical protein
LSNVIDIGIPTEQGAHHVAYPRQKLEQQSLPSTAVARDKS